MAEKKKDKKEQHTLAETSKCFEDTVEALLGMNHLFGHVLARLPVVLVGSDGVKGNTGSGSTVLRWHSQMCNLSRQDQTYLIEQVVLHSILGHMDPDPEYLALFGPDRVRMAQDLVTNQMNTVKPNEIKPPSINHYKLPKDLTWEEYARRLPPDTGMGGPGESDHETYLEMVNPTNPESVMDDISTAARDAIANSNYGTESQLIDELLKPQDAKFDLDLLFHVFLGRCRRVARRLVKRHLSRRYGKPPGLRSQPKATPKVLVCADVSGSMEDAPVELFIGAVRRIRNQIDGKFIQCDTKILNEMSLDELCTDTVHRKGRGGTCFKEIFKKAEDEEYTAVILCTDTWGEFPDKPFKGETLFVVPSDLYGKVNVPFGKIVPLIAQGEVRRTKSDD